MERALRRVLHLTLAASLALSPLSGVAQARVESATPDSAPAAPPAQVTTTPETPTPDPTQTDTPEPTASVTATSTGGAGSPPPPTGTPTLPPPTTPAPTASATLTPEPTTTPPVTDTLDILDLIPPDLAVLTATVNADGSETASVSDAGAGVLFLDGRVGAIAAAGAFPAAVNLVMLPEPITAYDPPVITSTEDIIYEVGLGAGPDQAPIRFTLDAYNAADGQPVESFNLPVQLVFDLRGIEGVSPGPNWYIAYQDQADPTLWHKLDVTVHDEAGLISAPTTHFSEWVTAPDEAGWHFRWNPPSISTFSGAASYHYPIEVPPGRNGLTPNIDFSYSSRGVDGLVLSNQDQGPLGLGWSLNNIEISRNGTHMADDGANLRMQHADAFQLVLDGASYDLKPDGATTNSSVRYYAENGPQLFIQRIYDAAATGANPDKFYWLVKTPDNTTYRLGYTADAESGQSGFIDVGGHAGAPGVDHSGMRWRVDTINDMYGNQIQYDYASWTQSDDYTNNGHNATITSGMRRLSEIRYNFISASSGVSDRRPAGDARSKIVLIGNSDNKRVVQIRLYHIDLTTPYRLIDIGRSTATHQTCGQSTDTVRINSLTQRNSNATLVLPATTFTHTVKSHAWSDCYQYDYVEQVDNGYGGKTKFTYTADGRYDDCPPIPLWDCTPSYGQAYFVTKTETWDGINASAAVVDYSYVTPCYDQTGGALVPGAINCPTHDPIPGPLFGTFPYDNGPLVGFATTTVTGKAFDGTTASKSISDFHQDAAKMGRAYREQRLDPVNVIEQTDTTYASAPVPSAALNLTTFTHASVVINTTNFGGQSQTHKVEYYYEEGAQGNAQYGHLTKTIEYDQTNTSYRMVISGLVPNTTTKWLVGQAAYENVYRRKMTGEPSCGALPDWCAVSSTWYTYDGDSNATFNQIAEESHVMAVRRWRNSGTANDYVDTRYTYNTWGNRVTETTYTSYGTASAYASTGAKQTSVSYDANNLYVLTVTPPIASLATNYEYYGVNGIATDGLPIGLLKRVLDPNSQATKYIYDTFGRLTKIVRPGDSDTIPTTKYTYSDLASPVGTGPLTVGNPGFETSADWYETDPNNIQAFTYDTTQKHSGSRSLKITISGQNPPPDHWVGNQNVSGYPWAGNKYWVSAWVKTTTSGQLCLAVSGRDGHEASAGCITATSTWQLVRGLVTMPVNPDADRFLILLRTPIVGTVYVDDVQVTLDLSNPPPTYLPLRVQTDRLETTGCGTCLLQTYAFYDGLGRLAQTRAETASGGTQAVTNLVYDALGRTQHSYVPVTGSTTSNFSRPAGWDSQPKTTTAYDALSRATLITAPDGTQTTHAYGLDITGFTGSPATNLWRHVVIDANSHARQSIQDAFGRTILVRELSGTNPWSLYAATTYGYDVRDNLTKTVDYVGYSASISYNALGQKTSMIDPDMGTWSYTYDAAGNLSQQTDARGQQVCFWYDNVERLSKKHHNGTTACPTATPASPTVSYTYDAGTNGKGRRTGMTDNSTNTTTWAYDTRGRVISENKVINGTGGGTFLTQWTYDTMDRPLSMTYPGGNTGTAGEVVNYTYTAQGLLNSLTAGATTYVQSTTYDAAGRVDVRILGANVLKQDYDYYPWTTLNGQGRLQYLKAGLPPAGTSLLNLNYTYDAVGNVLTIVDANAGGTQTQTFTYDALDRLYSAQASGGTEGAYAQEIYQYSTIGNLTSKAGVVQTYGVAQAGTCPEGALSKAHAVVTAGVNAYCYDQNGNLRRRTLGNPVYTLNYDGESRLTTVTGSATATFVYDGDGNRVKGTVNGATTVYIGNYYEWTGSTTTAKKYYSAGGQRIAMRTGSSTLNYLLGDHLGSTSITADSAGARVAELMYKPWGENRYMYLTTPTTLRYTGQRQESGLGGAEGLYFYNARWYDPTLGRFAQADSIVPEPDNPQSLNRYGYVLNNPLKYTDPSGHRPQDECPNDGCGADGTSDDLWHWEFDSQDYTDNLPWTSQEWADAATVLDGAALVSDIAAEAFVVALAAIGAVGATVEGTPVAGVAGAYAGYWGGQIAVRPVLVIGNTLATLATAANAVSEAKTGANRLLLEASINQGNIAAEANLSVGSGTQIGAITTGVGWIAPLSEMSLILQSAALAGDLGILSVPWGSVSVNIHFP